MRGKELASIGSTAGEGFVVAVIVDIRDDEPVVHLNDDMALVVIQRDEPTGRPAAERRPVG